MATTPPFDPFTQTFTLLLADSSPFNVTIPELDDFVFYNVNICINYASQLGGSLILLIVLLLLTKTDKRQSPIFILNALCLSLNTIRNILQCLYFAGPFSETYAYFGQDYSRVPRSTYATSVTATVLTFLLLLCVELSLILQVRVVCVTLRDIYRRGILVISVMIALVAIGFRLALCVENSRYIVSLTYLIPLTWLGSAANITTSISVCWFCAVFVTKLGFALEQRRKLGMGTFGPMQVIFIMGCQTLIIPAIFSILQYFINVPSMSSNVLTLVSIFLPLSSLWASASLRSNSPALKSPEPTRHPRLLSSFVSGSTGPFAHGKALDAQLSPSHTATTTTAINNSPLSSPCKTCHTDTYSDLEAQNAVGEKGSFSASEDRD
ncbi:hypothetical protein MMC12_001202 [Toensbergia leucococca]|nr:hypothetical protein [Toensbergia leucococca]